MPILHRLFLFALTASCIPWAYGQKLRLATPEGYVEARTTVKAIMPNPRADRWYHWVRAQTIHRTQGGYTGTLLHGPYSAFDAESRLVEQGKFRKGVKHGEWRYWNADGTLFRVEYWRNGRDVTAKRKEPWSSRHFKRRKEAATTVEAESPALTKAERQERAEQKRADRHREKEARRSSAEKPEKKSIRLWPFKRAGTKESEP